MPSPFPGMDPYLEDDGLWPRVPPPARDVPVSDSAARPGGPLPRPRRPAPLPHGTGPVHVGGARGASRGLHRDPPAQRRPAGDAAGSGQPRQQDDHRRAGPPTSTSAARAATPTPTWSKSTWSCRAADAGVFARRPARMGLRRHGDALDAGRSATRSTRPRCKSACRASACRWPPTTATRSSTCTPPSRAATTRAASRPRSTTSAIPSTPLPDDDRRWLNDVLKQQKLRTKRIRHKDTKSTKTK